MKKTFIYFKVVLILCGQNNQLFDKNKKLESITVYATKSAKNIFNVPFMVSKIYTDDLNYKLSDSLYDLLGFSSSVNINNGPRSKTQVLGIRGFDDDAILTLFDGRRQNFNSTHDGRIFFNPFVVKSIEVVKGASSSIYGGGALGGVIAFETKRASDFLKKGQDIGFFTSLFYGSASSNLAFDFANYGQSGNFDWVFNFSYNSSKDIKQGDSQELPSENNIVSSLIKTSYTFNDYNTLEFSINIFNNDGKDPNIADSAISSSNPLVDKKTSDNQISLKYSFDNPEEKLYNPQVHLYSNNVSVEEQDLPSSSRAGRIQERQVKTLGFTIDNQSKIKEHTLSYGLEFYSDEQVGTNSIKTDKTRDGVPNANSDNFGFYLQGEIKHKNYLFIPAFRFDSYSSKDDNGNSQKADKFSPKISFSYTFKKDSLVFLSLAQAFRAPHFSELYARGVHFSFPSRAGGSGPPTFISNNFVSTPDLKPEVTTNIEFGFGQKFKNLFSNNDSLELKTSYFHNTGKDFITATVSFQDNTTKSSNIPKALIKGFEIDTTYSLELFKFLGTLSYVRAENSDTGEYLDNSVPLTLTTQFSYKIKEKHSVAWNSRYARRNDKVSSQNAETAGYGVHNLYYELRYNDDINLNLGVENIFDKAYERRFASLLEEGRSFVLKLSCRW